MSKKRGNKPSTIWRTMYYFGQEFKKYWVSTLFMLISTPVTIFLWNFAGPWLISQIIDKISAGNIPEGDFWPTFLPYIFAFAATYIVSQLVIQRLRIYCLWKMELKSIYNLSKKCFDALSTQSMQFHNDRFSGSLVSQAGKFTSAFERLVDVTIFDLLPICFVLLFTIVILVPIAPLFVAVLMGFVVVYFLIAWFAFKKTAPLNQAEAEAQTKQSGQLADSISNILTVKSYGREEHERRRFANSNRATFNAGIKHMRASNIRDSLFGVVIVAINIFLVIFLVGGSTWFNLSIGTLILIFTYSQQITSTLWDINHVFRNVNRSFGDAHEMTLILDEEHAVSDAAGAQDLQVKKGLVTFDDITFTHADNKTPIFESFNLSIAPGERIGLVGRSGSGKTSLTKLLLRFADVQSGKILIDGQNISDITQVSLRENIAYVPQEATLFHRSLRENIAYSKPDATDDEVIKAAKLANAWEFIETLPDGLDTLTGERGVKLSGGQRQRIAIARAILKDAPILVLDEATSALDSESEKLIQDALKRLMQGRTSLVIAHRLSTVAELDRIIVLSDGKIVENGPHSDLINGEGEYAHLWNRQSGAFIENDD
jgi:ABC-type multidrug transport system, ATPase and permease components